MRPSSSRCADVSRPALTAASTATSLMRLRSWLPSVPRCARKEVDLDELREQVLAVVQETMQPARSRSGCASPPGRQSPHSRLACLPLRKPEYMRRAQGMACEHFHRLM